MSRIEAISPSTIGKALKAIDLAFSPSTFESAVTRAILSDIHSPSFGFCLRQSDGEIMGAILYSEVHSKERVLGWALGPVAVAPAHQGHGHGSHLVRESLQQPGIMDDAVFVLGDPAFYERFGFVSTASVICPFDPEGTHFRALRWDSQSEPVALEYHPAFSNA